MYASLKEEVPEESEAKEFPILCETCLGDNPYVRMTKENYGKACKICDRPFNIYRWRPGTNARYKKTEICPTCAKLKNVCQTCILDLQYGLPVQVRDSVLAEHEKVNLASDEVNREYQIEQYEKQVQQGTASLPYGKISASAMLQRMARKQPYYKRNEAHICSFFVKGECLRGVQCPYRHEMPITGELANQNIKDRFHGVNDPVAKKLFRRFADVDEDVAAIAPPEDTSITTLWIGGLDETISDNDIRDKFYPFGAISSVHIVHSKGCAFLSFTHRKAAEEAVKALHNSLMIKGLRLRVAWGKKQDSAGPRPRRAPPGLAPAAATPTVVNPEANSYLNLPKPVPPPSFVAPPPGMENQVYPSMDPRYMGTKMTVRED
eukprot:TRINITY_DN4352_c0_g1_i2.p1 TRINITY_DN4352_c0_g1~~TRINITY_DN4352_c0_g1_i2.p1  ORF type:complete len:400 (-),score=98.87 TRINITY_DN4352_c0_g1_i2:92-1222(-)